MASVIIVVFYATFITFIYNDYDDSMTRLYTKKMLNPCPHCPVEIYALQI